MYFPKINRFAGILAIAFASLFYDNASALNEIYLANEYNICKIESGSCNNTLYRSSATNITQVSSDEFLYINSGKIYKYTISTNSSDEIFDTLPYTSQIAYRNGNIAILTYDPAWDPSVFVADINGDGTFTKVAGGAYWYGGLDFNTDGTGLFYNTESGTNFVEIGGSPVFFKLSNKDSRLKTKDGFLYYQTTDFFYKVDENGGDSIQLGSLANSFNGAGFDINNSSEKIITYKLTGGLWRVYEINISDFSATELYSVSTVNPWGIISIREYEPPTPPPAEISINGLSCVSEIIPDLQNVTWYNDFMDNTGFLSSVDDDGWIRFYSWSGSIYDLPQSEYVNRAALYYADQTAGGVFASGSLNYPGTERTKIRGGNKSPLLLSFSDSEVKPNILQWHGVNNVALGYAGTVQIQNTQLKETSEFPLTATGGVATAVISGNERINKALINYSSGFNGFRYGVAPLISKNACDYKYNICNWVIKGNETTCESGNLVGGIPAGNCVITGSGSVYGSGSCVPETNSSGAIIPPVLVPGITIYDSNGDPVGNIYNQEEIVPEFSCGYSPDDSWTDKIGKTFECVVNFFKSSAELGEKGVNSINGTTQQLGETLKQDIGTNTGTTATGSSNMLLNTLYGIDEGAVEYQYVKIVYGLLIFAFTAFLIVIISMNIKSGINKFNNN